MFKPTDSASFQRDQRNGVDNGLLRLRSDQRLINRIVSLASGDNRFVAADLPVTLKSEIAALTREQLLGLIEYSAALIVLAD